MKSLIARSERWNILYKIPDKSKLHIGVQDTFLFIKP